MTNDQRTAGPPTEPAPVTGFGSAMLPGYDGYDGYDIGPVIGRGGTGVVHRAVRRSDGRQVAIKLLRHACRDDDVLTLRHVLEGRYLERVKHPHVVAVHAAIPGPHEPAIVMEYVEGRSLRALLRPGFGAVNGAGRGPGRGAGWSAGRSAGQGGADGPVLSFADACLILGQVASGLAAVHEQGLVHRDIKPDNVLVTVRDGRPHALIADFGIAYHRDGPRLTRAGTGGLVGTPEYLAPELRAGDVPTGAADCFALGVMAYELFAGERPFDRAGRRSGPPPRPRGLPDGAWEVVLACLSVRPEDRPDAALLAEWFAELSESPTARPTARSRFGWTDGLPGRRAAGADVTEATTDPGATGPADPLAAAADALAEHLRRQWEQDAAARGLTGVGPIPVRWRWSRRPVTGPVEAVLSGAERGPFEPLPGTFRPTGETIREGGVEDLFGVYGGLGSGRVVVLGAPGSGKSAAAILTVLDALQRRRRLDGPRRAEVPVPVLLTVYGWDPRARTLADWFAERLAAAYPFLRSGRYGGDTAAALVREGRVALFLDGFDEMAEPLRREALRAVDRQRLPFRLVLLTRADEFARVAAAGHLRDAAALELEPVGTEDAAGYLTRTMVSPLPEPWRRLIDRLRREPDSVLARALDSPLNLTLLRDGFTAPGDLEALLEPGRFTTRADVEELLLDRLLPEAYRDEPGVPSTYRLAEARAALGYLAARMREHGARDLVWWHLHCWFSPVPRVFANGAMGAILMALAGALVFGPAGRYALQTPAGTWTGAWFGVVFGACLGLVIGMLAGLAGEFRGFRPSLRGSRPTGRPRVNLPVGLLAGLAVAVAIGQHGHYAFGVPAGLVIGVWAARSSVRVLVLADPRPWASIPFDGPIGMVSGLLIGAAYAVDHGAPAGLAAAAVAGLCFGVMVGVARPITNVDVPTDPAASWRRDRWRGVSMAVAYALPLGLELGIEHASGHGVLAGAVAGAGFGLPIAIAGMMAMCDCWRAWLAFVQMHLHGGFPVNGMRFLADAHARGILRTVGPLYQFRHARLQDRLAAEHAVRPGRSG